jgi:AraC-like DNA-binding protein
VALARLATRHPVCPARVTAARLPADPARVAEYLGVPVDRAATESITFSDEDTVRPFLTENEEMRALFAPELRERLTDLLAGARVSERVRAALLESLPAGDGRINAVSNLLAVSVRSLQRQLRLEGTTYQAVLAATRQQLARHYLTQTSMSAAEIAFLLGYDDTSSFYRAFRTWTGTTPDRLRASGSAVALTA